MKKYLILALVALSLTMYQFRHHIYMVYYKPIINLIHTYDTAGKREINVGIVKNENIRSLEDMSLLRDILVERYKVNVYDIDGPIGDTKNPKMDILIYGPSDHFQALKDQAIPDDPNLVKFYISYEAMQPALKGFDLSISLRYLDAANHLRLPSHYYYNVGHKALSSVLQLDYNRGTCRPKKRYFACFLVSNGNEGSFDGSSARIELFHRLSVYKKVMSGGKHLNNIGKVISPDDTFKWLSKCKFIIAYENANIPGYLTEKLAQAYKAGAVPIYYGDSKALSELNKDAVIYSGDFPNQQAVADYVIKVDQDDELYCKIWDQSLVTDPQFSYEAVAKNFRARVEEVLDRKLGVATISK